MAPPPQRRMDAARGPCCWSQGVRPPAPARFFSFTPFEPESMGLCCPLPQRTAASCEFPGWVSISVTLFCFLKIPPAGLPREDVLLLGSFFQKRSVSWSVGTDGRLQTWPCVLEGEQQAAGGSWRAGAGRPTGRPERGF